jgi:hypothetical protein
MNTIQLHFKRLTLAVRLEVSNSQKLLDQESLTSYTSAGVPKPYDIPVRVQRLGSSGLHKEAPAASELHAR